ncbi:MAG: hypothetical protein WCO29_10910 [Nostocales cyanobacterium ELA583]|jgi:hypothetical protein
MTALYRNRSDRFSDLWKGIALLIPKSDRSSFIKVILPESDRFFDLWKAIAKRSVGIAF